ncbi:phage virion morphogenesis protein [Flavilitoribacter nigricans]|uniref:Phage morphogenesis protein n=1 Tax=Flavilitoribacter nigricans (strain ATCC 23147 / DSM 23189 / NBRC 102662 / NCIMB 1420 / SS-2) TaxID=1122177 RepID=A0A2D0MXE6_FLAN2|nr:phage virion morphogenesis protein [Flavilitoribacter nigricans]PHN00579.1 hypothetical protein CRP01_41490 [Flavilitoribacter nigricans DSM 23189 = NBRC 102662]
MPTEHQFAKIVENYKVFKKSLAVNIGEEAVSFAKDNFRRQGFKDAILIKWRRRKAGTPRNQGRAILVDTGRLKRSIRITRISRAGNRVYIGSNVQYAQIHNEGGRVSGRANVRSHYRRNRTGGRSRVRAHTRQVNFRMPKRQFIGPSRELNKRIRRLIRLNLIKVFK